MLERNISEEQLIELLETGDTRFKDDTRLWIAKTFPKRTDNLVCAAVVLEDQLVLTLPAHRASRFGRGF